MVLRAVADLHQVLEFAVTTLRVGHYAQVQPVLLAALAHLVGADTATLTHLDLRTQHEVALLWPTSRACDERLGEYARLAAHHPLRDPVHHLWTTKQSTPVRISDVVTARQWRSSALQREAMPDVSDQMTLPVSVSGATLSAVALARSSGSFTDRQRDVLAATAQHLRAALGRAHVDGQLIHGLQLSPSPAWIPLGAAPGQAPPAIYPPTTAPLPPVPTLSPREHEVLELVATGLTDAQVARRLGLRPATVSKHLRRVYARHHLPNRAAAVSLLGQASCRSSVVPDLAGASVRR